MYSQNSLRLFKNCHLYKNNVAFLRYLHFLSRNSPKNATSSTTTTTTTTETFRFAVSFNKKLSLFCRAPCIFYYSNRGIFVNYSPQQIKVGEKRLVFIPTRLKAGSGYTNFGHGRYKPTAYQYVLGATGFFVVGVTLYLVLFDKDVEIPLNVKAASLNNSGHRSKSDEPAENEDGEEEEEEEKDTKQIKTEKNSVTFRDRKIIAYEDRIRAYSTPDKIFRYFATLKVYPKGEPQHGPNFEVFMTPDDFVRSISPGVMQPEGLGLEQFVVFDPDKDKDHSRYSLEPDSVFYHMGRHGLISLTDYIFLLTVLSTSARHFALAFKMFDINGDGELDYNEFEMVETVIQKQTSTGLRHREPASGNMIRHQTSSSLAKFFFGPNLDQKLTIERFLEFQEHLQRDILKLEFKRREPVDNRISEVAFSKMLLQHSQLSEKNQQKMIKRVKKYYKDESSRVGISLVDVEDFFRFLNNINDVDTALTFYHMAGASVDAPTLQHVAASVAGVNIPDNMIEVVFALFDENHDGELSNREFVNIMKKRLMRGLERPKDTGLTRVLSAMWKCAWERGSEKHAYRFHPR